MLDGYFNYRGHTVEAKWDRGGFIRRWRSIYASDRRWIPPYHPLLRHALVAQRMPHVARMHPGLLYIEALPGRRRDDNSVARSPSMTMMEATVCASVVMVDPRRRDGTAYLSLLHCVNDEESIERFFGMVMEHAWKTGARRVIGPVGLSPHIQCGALEDHYHLIPPLHTPYNPPYLPEVLQSVLEPMLPMHLYHMPCTVENAETKRISTGHSSLTVRRAQPTELSSTLLPLATESNVFQEAFPSPDQLEVEFLTQWYGTFPVTILVVEEAEMPVGLAVMQADLGRSVIRAKGGRNPLWRLWLSWRSRRRSSKGRLLMLSVAPERRGAGIGRYLWQNVCQEAARLGWDSLSIGPVPDESSAAAFLSKMGAHPQQGYHLYASEL